MTDHSSFQVSGYGRPRLALALQGGGAHGAYGWGVLERLLAEDVEIVAVSGTSAGALNGTALVAGLVLLPPKWLTGPRVLSR
ncbi:MAG: patatin-like phospholipase family protein [Sphingomonas adhaesiva]|uniref:patatin-like phospholipase family protein n=1 Tax=Sphingomonas adhaesiva TaxID=28212 RepID=UPI002FF748C0